MSGVYASERLSFMHCGKAFWGKPRRKPESGNPTFRACRGARGNVTCPMLTKCARLGFYPDPEGNGITLMSTDELVKQSFASLKAGAVEIRPGQSKQLAFLRRLAPDFINGQLWKMSKKLVPLGMA